MPPQFVTNASPYGLFLQQQLTRTLPTLYKVKYDDLWALNPAQSLHNAIADLPLGLEFIDAYAMGDTGQMAALYDGLGDDVPVVDVTLAKLPPIKTAIFIQGAWWTEFELERMKTAIALGTNFPTLDIVQAKQAAVGEYFNRREHYTSLYGYPKKGLYGIFSLRGISTPDATFTPYRKVNGDYVVTTKQLYDDITSLVYMFMERARLTSPNQVIMVVPPKLERRLVEIYIDTAGNMFRTGLTVKQMLQSTELGMGVNLITSRMELQGTDLTKYVPNESNTAMYDPTFDRIMFKSVNYELERHYYPRRPKPVFPVNSIKYEQITIGATSGIMNFEPERVWYYDFKNTLV
jgi:hypothetical protein